MPVSELLYAFINLLALSLFLFFVLRKSVKKSLSDRRDDFIKKSEEALQYSTKSLAKLSEANQKLKNIKEDGETYLNNIKENSYIVAQKTVEEAQKTAKMITVDAEQKGESEFKRTKNELKKAFVSTVISDVKNSLIKKIDERTTDAYIDEYSAAFKKERMVNK